MTYLSYYRAKQNELLALVEKADLISQKNITPILEPVNLTYKPIAKACKKLNDKDCSFIIIANSTVGKCHIESPDHVNHIKEIASKNTENKIGLLIDPSKFEIKKLLDFIAVYKGFNLVAIHPKPNKKDKFFDLARDYSSISKNFSHDIFLSDNSYSTQIKQSKSIIKNEFISRNNSEYKEEEHFSDLHLKYNLDNFSRFGDFNIVGDSYSEGGGPAYAVAIHVTYISPIDNSIRIIHAKSISNNDRNNPEIKYNEARMELIRIINSKKYNITLTSGLKKIIEDDAYHGLGMLKRFCMEHHLELIGKHII